jgi:predicted ATPase/DNA-binding SARP family transcriptional activator
MIEFGVLGPLRVTAPEGELPVAGARQRALLGRLLVEPGVTVSADTLAAAVWDAPVVPPRDPRAALQVQVSRLRTQLRSLGHRLATSPPGYRLDIPVAWTDAYVFGREVRKARELAAWDPATALAVFDEALALWRGPAFVEFADTFARPEAVRLEQLRSLAREERVKVLWALGDADAAVADAEALISADPLREGPYVAAMGALAAAGRPGEALVLYRRLRETLARELGIDPSPEAQTVHVEVLRGDARYDGGRARRADRTVPAPVSTFFGRADELAAVSAAFGVARAVTITGPAGVGKTRLAVEWATAAIPAASVAWIDLEPVRDAAEVPLAFLDGLGLTGPPGQPPAEVLVTALRPRDMVLIVDNCEHVVDAAAATVSGLLRACPRLRLLITSRERLAAEGEHVVVLQPLTGRPAAAQLFLDRMTASGHPVDPGNHETLVLVERVCRRLDGLPLALELTAAHAATLGLHTVAEAADLLDLASRRRAGRESHQSLRAALAWSYDRLTDAERGLLRRLSVFPGRFPVDWAVSICADGVLTVSAIPVLLASLIDKSLVVRRTGSPPDHTMLETVRRYCAEQLEAAGEAPAARARYAGFVVSWVETAAAGLGRGDDRQLPAAVSDMRAARAWARAHDTGLALRLSAALRWYAELRGDSEITGWAEEAGRGDGDPRVRATALAMTASGVAREGDLDRAGDLLDTAESLLGEDSPAAPFVAWIRGTVALLGGRADESARAATTGWRSATALADPWGMLMHAGGLAVLAAREGQIAASAEWLDRCTAAGRALPGPSAQSMVAFFTALSTTFTDPPAAVYYYGRSHDLAMSVGLYQLAGSALLGSASVAYDTEPSVAALVAYRDVLSHWERIGDRARLWITLREMARGFGDLGHDETVLAVHTALRDSPVTLDGEGPELAALNTAVTRSARRLGDRAESLRRRWQGAPLHSVMALVLSELDGLAPEPGTEVR